MEVFHEEFRSLGKMVNTAIERMAEAEKLKRRADAFVKFNPQAIAVLAGDKHRLDLNKQYEKAWRGSYDELMAKKLYDFNIKTTGDDFYASFKTKKMAVSDMEISWEDRTKTYLRLFQLPILDENGEICVNLLLSSGTTPHAGKRERDLVGHTVSRRSY